MLARFKEGVFDPFSIDSILPVEAQKAPEGSPFPVRENTEVTLKNGAKILILNSVEGTIKEIDEQVAAEKERLIKEAEEAAEKSKDVLDVLDRLLEEFHKFNGHAAYFAETFNRFVLNLESGQARLQIEKQG